MNKTTGLPRARFLQTLEIVAREGKHLSYSWNSGANAMDQRLPLEFFLKRHTMFIN